MTPCPARGARPAVTLLELLMVLSVVGVLALITFPRAARYIDAIRVGSATREVVNSFTTARHLAIARGQRAAVHIDPEQGTIEVTCDRERILIRDLVGQYGVALRSTRDSMAYDPIGIGYGAANLKVIITRGEAADTVIISRAGRVRTGRR